MDSLFLLSVGAGWALLSLSLPCPHPQFPLRHSDALGKFPLTFPVTMPEGVMHDGHCGLSFPCSPPICTGKFSCKLT